MTWEDKFMRKWWKRNRSYWNQLRTDKKQARRKFRHMMNAEGAKRDGIEELSL